VFIPIADRIERNQRSNLRDLYFSEITMAKLSIKDLALSGKRVVMRVDFNVPMKERLKQSRCLLIPQF